MYKALPRPEATLEREDLGTTESGVELEYRATKFLDDGGASLETHYKIVNKKDDHVMVSTTDEKFFNLVKEPMAEIVGKTLTYLNPREVYQNAPYFKAIEDFSYIVNRAKELKFSPLETAFFALTLTRMDVSGLPVDKLSSIISRHVDMFNDGIVDTVPKALAVLNPARARLGLDNYTLTGRFNFTEEHLEKLQENNLDELLKIFCGAVTSASETDGRQVRKIGLPVISKTLKGKGNILEIFFSLPIQYAEFREYMLDLTVDELKVVKGVVSKDFPLGVNLESADYAVQVMARTNSTEVIRESKVMIDEIFDQLLESGMNYENLVGANHWMLKTGIAIPSTLTVISKVLSDSPGRNFDALVELLSGKSTFWLKQSSMNMTQANSADFVVSKLLESVGAEKTVDMLKQMSTSDKTLSMAQWVDVSLHPDDFVDIPVAWWGELAGGETNE